MVLTNQNEELIYYLKLQWLSAIMKGLAAYTRFLFVSPHCKLAEAVFLWKAAFKLCGVLSSCFLYLLFLHEFFHQCY